MKRIALLPISLLVFGCSAHHMTPAVAEAPLQSAKVFPMTFDNVADEANPYISQSTDTRSVGDWVTTEFAANGRPITVQQRVLSRDGAASVVEVAIKDAGKTQTFRMRTQTTAAGEQVLDVTKVEGGIEHATTMATYEAALQKTVPTVDRNDGMIDVEPVTIDLGSRKIEAVRTTYKVVAGGKPATMSVIHSDAFAWGDLGGDIVTESGKKLYSTRVVEAGDATAAVADRK
jgi:hypothetical protein